jgi:fatty-acyl-CoA synthase
VRNDDGTTTTDHDPDDQTETETTRGTDVTETDERNETSEKLLQTRTLSRLREAGLLEADVQKLIARVKVLPWLIGRGASLGLVVQIHGDATPDEVAIIDRHGELTWGEYDRRVNQAASALGQLGVDPGGRVGMLLRNGREWAELVLACQKSGRVASPMNTWATGEELKALLEEMDPDVLVYDVRSSDAVEAAAPDGLPLVAVGEGETVTEAHRYEDLLASGSSEPPKAFGADRGAGRIVIHTSGTTGTPKGAGRSTGMKELAGIVGLLTVVPYDTDDVVLLPAPMFHAFGLLTFSLSTLLGATLVLPDKFDPAETLENIERHRATALSLVPVMVRRILDLPDEQRTGHDLSSLRILLTSGSAMPQELRERTMGLFGDVHYDLYGSTESGWVAVARPQDIHARPGTQGRPVPGVTVQLKDDDGEPVPAGESGEVHVQSAVTFEGYLSGDEPDAGVATGDLARIDEDGFLYIEGRADDMVVVGGENVYPAEVERVIDRLDGVHDVAVLGVDDEEYGQVLAAFVVGDVDEETVVNRCQEDLAPFKVPKHVRFVDEFPRTATGKIRKVELEEELQSS